MQMRAPLQIHSLIKAMTDVVLPAVDPQNKLAQEQARLIIGMLGLMAKQLPLQFHFDCDELARLVEFSRQLQCTASGGAETRASLLAVAASGAHAGALLERAKADPQEIEHAVRALRTTTGAAIAAVYRDGDAACQSRVQAAVLAMSKEQLLRDRSWLLPQGWEPAPESVPTIETLLGWVSH